MQARAFGVRGHHDERALQRLRIARELDGGRVGEMLAPARNGGQQQAARDHAETAGEENGERDGLETRRILAAASRAHDARSEIGDDEQAEDPRGEPHVDLHVAVEDVAELVTDDGLQLISIQVVERALRDRDGRFVRRVSGRERIDALLVRKHEHLGLAHARGDRHLFHDVDQALAREIVVLVVDLDAAERARDHRAARAQLRALVPAGAEDDREQHGECAADEAGRIVPGLDRIAREADDQHERHGRNDDEDRGDEGRDQPSRLAALDLLAFEKLAAHVRACSIEQKAPN
jgi:hypothetical protein